MKINYVMHDLRREYKYDENQLIKISKRYMKTFRYFLLFITIHQIYIFFSIAIVQVYEKKYKFYLNVMKMRLNSIFSV